MREREEGRVAGRVKREERRVSEEIKRVKDKQVLG